MNTVQVINYAVFVILMVATVFGLSTIWGTLFLYWVIPNFYSGHAFLISDIKRDDDPVLFWLIQVTWVVLGVVLLISDFIPALV